MINGCVRLRKLMVMLKSNVLGILLTAFTCIGISLGGT
jgi:hypothetical protein